MPEPTQKCKLNTILMQNCALKLLIVLNIAFLLDYWSPVRIPNSLNSIHNTYFLSNLSHRTS